MFDDPVFSGLCCELLGVASRLVGHIERTTGQRLPARRIIAWAIEQTVDARNKRTAKEARAIDNVPSLTAILDDLRAGVVPKGLAAVVRTDEVDPFTFTFGMDLRGGRKFVDSLATRFHGEANQETAERILRAAIDRGLDSLKDEANFRVR